MLQRHLTYCLLSDYFLFGGKLPPLYYSLYLKYICLKYIIKRAIYWASLVVQWLRIHLPKQGTQVRALVREDLTCHGATKPMRHNY